MTDVDIPSSYELEHLYTELLKRLPSHITDEEFVLIHLKMKQYRYQDALWEIWAALDAATTRATEHIRAQFLQSRRYLSGGTADFDAEAIAATCDKIGELAKLLKDWRDTDEKIGGPSVVQAALRDFDIKFDDEDLTKPPVAV